MKTITNKRSYLTNVTNFLDRFAGPAVQMEDDYGLPAEAVLAQLALETGWGKKVLKLYPEDGGDLTDSMNLFNIKASKSWDGMVGLRKVWEDKNKDGYRQSNEYKMCKFRMYDSYEEAFNDYARLILQAERYEPAVDVADDPELYVEALQECGYATDGRYASKIISIMKKNFKVEVAEDD